MCIIIIVFFLYSLFGIGTSGSAQFLMLLRQVLIQLISSHFCIEVLVYSVRSYGANMHSSLPPFVREQISRSIFFFASHIIGLSWFIHVRYMRYTWCSWSYTRILMVFFFSFLVHASSRVCWMLPMFNLLRSVDNASSLFCWTSAESPIYAVIISDFFYPENCDGLIHLVFHSCLVYLCSLSPRVPYASGYRLLCFSFI